MSLMGWPTMKTNTVSERELRSLTGEGIHVGCKAALLASVFCIPAAPWWGSAGGLNAAVLEGLVGESGPGTGQPPKRRRRLGPVKSMP